MTRSLSNLLKVGTTISKSERIIDYNDIIKDRVEAARAASRQKADSDGFINGLNADVVERLPEDEIDTEAAASEEMTQESAEAARAEVSPIVSVAETKKIKITEKIALALNSGLKGINEGTAIIEVPESEEKSTTPINTATIYPTISPNKTESCLKYDFAKILKIIHESNVIVPRIQFVAEPKFSLPLPPPKELAPTERREKPMEVTTLAATIGDISLIQYFAKRPRTPSTIPPTRTAPTMVLYP